MILEIGDDNVALRIESSSSRCCESFQIATVIDSIERESRDEVTVRTEQLNAMIARVSYENLGFRVDGASPWIHKLAQLFAI